MRKRVNLSRRRLLGAGLVIAACLFLAVLPAFVFGRTPPDWVPVPVQNWAFDVRLMIASPAKKVLSISYGSYKDDRVYVGREGTDVTFESEGLTLAGTLYRPQADGLHPGIVLLHGSTPEGRKLGLYRILGNRLAERGYVVLSMDRRGYGDSDDPPKIDSLEDFAPVDDFVNAVDYLLSLDTVDPERLYTIGHSEGADLALTGGIHDSRILKIVAIGPSRRVHERMGAENDPEWDYFQRRSMRYMELSQPIPSEVALEARMQLPLENHIDYFSDPGHKPLLLIDGMLESEADRVFLEELCETISEPRKCSTLTDANHYANTANFGSIIIFDEQVVGQLVEEIDAWLKDG